ncbi:unnamed protein product [Choristocarpus tenellus]
MRLLAFLLYVSIATVCFARDLTCFSNARCHSIGRPDHLALVVPTSKEIAEFGAVGLGASVGAMLRHALSASTPITRRPWAVCAINVTGSLALGGLSACTPLSTRTRLLLGTGLCGGYTTFSTYALDLVGMAKAGRFAGAAVYASANNLGGICGALLGAWLASHLLGGKGAAAS